ncbi:FliM/FliN family flagellar motor switch protein [Hyphomonas pacifica]|uniref:Flagellar motor switch protein FliN-like C-terminal domain-containing protein n=1 Tax=Hyphomonas pacifica TaxID=1280941 RepID=A0A062TWL5_9PROT|nr:FliM/FliN family flagellar motor switch protein [Hyphomonas pacifica]KCZ52426.1 hypothetical protein HY2_08410 [Hyphomonas pacifica]RAN35199.1 hypothetical protein HY3_09010 [Hyphomonas pacifica]RAN37328.1 hypothetical protein HY11_09540 [Hyphomonas pacifica]
MRSTLPLAADDGWDMSPRREADIMLDMPTTFEPITPKRPLPTSRGVLSPAEIEALLRPNLDDMPDIPEEPEVTSDKPIPDLAPEPPARPRLRPVVSTPLAADISEDARRLAARLSLALRDGCGLKAAATVRAGSTGSFDQALYPGSAPAGSAIACFAAPGGEIAAMMVLSAPLVSALIETACGGKPAGQGEQEERVRQLTLLDTALLEALVRPLGPAIAPALRFARIETDEEFAAALANPGDASILDLDVRVETVRMTARLILAEDDLFDASEAPAARTRPVQPASAPVETTPEPKAAPAAMTAVLTARIASLSVPMSRLANLKAGSTLLLGVPADQPVELLTGGRDGPVAAEGQIGRKGNRMALRITRRTQILR